MWQIMILIIDMLIILNLLQKIIELQKMKKRQIIFMLKEKKLNMKKKLIKNLIYIMVLMLKVMGQSIYLQIFPINLKPIIITIIIKKSMEFILRRIINLLKMKLKIFIFMKSPKKKIFLKAYLMSTKKMEHHFQQIQILQIL